MGGGEGVCNNAMAAVPELVDDIVPVNDRNANSLPLLGLEEIEATLGFNNTPPPKTKTKVDVGCFIREQAKARGFPTGVCELFANKWCKETKLGYSYKLQAWINYNIEKQSDPGDFNIQRILDSIVWYFSGLDKSYGATCTFVTLIKNLRKVLGPELTDSEEEKISWLMSGVFNEKPPIPRSVAPIWDINLVLKYLGNLPTIENQGLAALSRGLATLIMLATMCRAGELLLLDLDYLTWEGKDAVFGIPTPVKSFTKSSYQKRGKELQQIRIANLPQADDRITPVKLLKRYIFKTERHRETRKLFMTTTGRYSAIAKFTLTRWIKSVLKSSGIDLSKYKVHSVRGASSSAAFASGIAIDLIMEKASWAQPSVFVNYYLKPISGTKVAKKMETLCKNPKKLKSKKAFISAWAKQVTTKQQLNRNTLRRRAWSLSSKNSTVSTPSISAMSSSLTESSLDTSATKVLLADESILNRYLNDNARAIQQELEAKRATQSGEAKERKKARYNVMTSILKEAWGMDGTNPKLLKLTQPAQDKIVPKPVKSSVTPNSVAHLLEIKKHERALQQSLLENKRQEREESAIRNRKTPDLSHLIKVTDQGQIKPAEPMAQELVDLMIRNGWMYDSHVPDGMPKDGRPFVLHFYFGW